MSDSSDSGIGSDDEIRQIKHAMRVAKTRQVALKQELGASLRHEEEVVRCHRQRCKDQADEIVQLRLKLVSRDDEIQFLQAKLAEKDKSLREAAQLSKLKNTAAIASLWDSLKALEKRVADRRLVISEECDGLQRLVAGLEQHAMGGHHMVSSRTAIGLFIKMRESIGEIKAIAGEDGDAAKRLSQLSQSVDRTKPLVSETGTLKDLIADKTGRAPGPGGKRDGQRSADQAYLDLCRYLEEENGRLQRSVELGQAELERCKAEAEAAALIPQYRLAIVRARSQAGQLQDQLIKEQNANKWLRGQLDRAHKELQTKLVTPAPESFTQGQEENPKSRRKQVRKASTSTNRRTSQHTHSSHSSSAMRGSSCCGGKSSASSTPESNHCRHSTSVHASAEYTCSDSGGSDMHRRNAPALGASGRAAPLSSCSDLHSREREVEMDLEALDEEIELLKDRLEQAALSHTQRVVSQVVSSTPGAILA